jgi:hypothetical protein
MVPKQILLSASKTTIILRFALAFRRAGLTIQSLSPFEAFGNFSLLEKLKRQLRCLLVSKTFIDGKANELAKESFFAGFGNVLLRLQSFSELLRQFPLAIVQLLLTLLDNDFASLHGVFFFGRIKVEMGAPL